MAAMLVGATVRCTLCREPLGTPGHLGGREPHAVLFRTRGSGEGMLLCDDCHILAELPPTVPLN